MKCPYCGAEMKKGYFQNNDQPVQWISEGQKPSPWRGQLAKGSIPLGEGSWLKGYRAKAFCCIPCQIVIAPVKEPLQNLLEETL